jgi:hypothetical protein
MQGLPRNNHTRYAYHETLSALGPTRRRRQPIVPENIHGDNASTGDLLLHGLQDHSGCIKPTQEHGIQCIGHNALPHISEAAA